LTLLSFCGRRCFDYQKPSRLTAWVDCPAAAHAEQKMLERRTATHSVKKLADKPFNIILGCTIA
jgi:hypothetical protein